MPISTPSIAELFASLEQHADKSVSPINLKVDIESLLVASETISIERLQVLLTRLESKKINLLWQRDAWTTFSLDPTTLSLPSILALHTNVNHLWVETTAPIPLIEVRKKINDTKAAFDWFGERCLLCADHLGLGTPTGLYKEPASRALRSREEFEEVIFPFVQAVLAINVNKEAAFLWRESLSSIIYELVENTEIHARVKGDGSIVRPSIRGIMFRQRPFFQYFQQREHPSNSKSMLELIVFDCGRGYYEKYTGRAIDETTSLIDESEVMNRCLASHHEDDSKNPHWGVHGVGLYEVLRALKFLGGAIEVRSGRLHMYRSFIRGDMALRLESQEEKRRPGMPKAELLDYKNKVVARPTKHEKLIGSAIRVVIPYGREAL